MEKRDFNTEFCNGVAEASDRLQNRHGSMRKVYYHEHHLPNEAIGKLREYGFELGRNKQKARDLLLEAAAAIMGEFNRLEGY